MLRIFLAPGPRRRWLVALMLAAGGLAARADGPAPAAPAVVVLGDSLSAAYGLRPEQGWVALLAAKLSRLGYGYRVVNASVSGETTAGGLARLPRVLALHHPAVLVLELGANDGLRGLPLAEPERHLRAMVRAARAAHARVVLVGMRLPPNFGPEYGEGFAALYARIAREEGAALVPFLLAPIALDAASFQADGLHPIAAAEPQVLETVWSVLAPELGARAMH